MLKANTLSYSVPLCLQGPHSLCAFLSHPSFVSGIFPEIPQGNVGLKNRLRETSIVVKNSLSNEGDMDSIPHQATKIP